MQAILNYLAPHYRCDTPQLVATLCVGYTHPTQVTLRIAAQSCRNFGLVLGSRLTFTDRGDHELKGVPGPWRVFSVDDLR
jgi:hypothetical protein